MSFKVTIDERLQIFAGSLFFTQLPVCGDILLVC